MQTDRQIESDTIIGASLHRVLNTCNDMANESIITFRDSDGMSDVIG